MGRFERIDAMRDAEMMQVNIVALAELTHALLPAMLARRRGKIMLVASTASFLPCPNMAVYGATKAFVRSFGEALAEELKGSGVTVNVLWPGHDRDQFLRRGRRLALGGADAADDDRRGRREARLCRAGARRAGHRRRADEPHPRIRRDAYAAHFITLPATARMMAQD